MDFPVKVFLKAEKIYLLGQAGRHHLEAIPFKKIKLWTDFILWVLQLVISQEPYARTHGSLVVTRSCSIFTAGKIRDFCLVSDFEVQVNAHFIGKKSKKGRYFTWVHSIGILFTSHKLHLGARKVSKWQPSADYIRIQLDGHDIAVPTGEGNTRQS